MNEQATNSLESWIKQTQAEKNGKPPRKKGV
jgi:hypothetical protein